MTYIEKGEYLFTKYQQVFILNVIFALLFMCLDLGVGASLIFSAVFIALAIGVYFIRKPLGFLTVSIAIGSTIAAVYQHLEMGLTISEGSDKLAIAPVIILLLIIEFLYVIMKIIIIYNSHKNVGILLTLALSIGITVGSYILSSSYPQYFSGIFYITLFLMSIFFSSIVCTLYLDGGWPIQRLLMVSYVIIFVLVFGIALCIILEEGSIMEIFIPDSLPERKNKQIKL